MSLFVSWLITLLVVSIVTTFVIYLVGLRGLPLADRPRTPTFNRFGQFLDYEENPDYRENPGEEEAPTS
jgi:hypothetical protein